MPASAALARELLSHLVPHVLGVDEHAVEVEDDRLDRAQTRVTLSGPMSRTEADPGEAHGKVEVGAQVADDLSHTVFSARSEAPDVGAAQSDRGCSQRERAEDVRAGANAAV